MLKSLELRNFKSIAKLKEPLRFAPITGLFGANSSGKTSIMQLFLMLKQTVESPDLAQVLNFGDSRTYASLGSFRDVVFGRQQGESLAWSFSWQLPKRLKIADPAEDGAVLFAGLDMGFSGEVSGDVQGRAIVDSMVYTFSGHEFAMRRVKQGKGNSASSYELSCTPDDFQFKQARGRPSDLPPPVKCYGFPDQVRARYQNASLLSDFALAFEGLFSRLYYLGPLRDFPRREYTWAGEQPADMGQRGERAVDALLALRTRGEQVHRGRGYQLKTLEKLVAYWLRELKLIHDFRVKPVAEGSNLYRVRVHQSAKSASVLITDVGFGVSQILPVITLCYYVPKGSIIVLEHPEIHLHPMAQAGLADLFIDAVKTRNVQIILESHSEHLLQRLQRRIAEEQIQREQTAFYFCRMSGGQTEVDPLQVDMYGNIRNWPTDFFGDRFGEAAAMATAAARRRKATS